MIGAPVRCATMSAPGANDCAGPRGPSGVIAESLPVLDSRAQPEQRAAAPRDVDPRTVRKPNDSRDARDDLAVAVLADQHRDALVAMMIEQRQQLAVPEREDDRLSARAQSPSPLASLTTRNRHVRASSRTSQHAAYDAG